MTYRGSVAVAGRPQSGKTTWAVREFMAEPGYAIFIEPMQRPDKFPGLKHYFKLPDVLRAMHDGEKKVVWFTDDGAAVEQFLEGHRVIRGRLYAARHVPPELTVYIDEIDQFANKTAPVDSAIVRCVTKCGNYSMRMIVMTQRLSMASKSIYACCYEWVIYDLGDPDIAALRQEYRIDVPPAVVAHIHKDYHYARWTSGRWTLGYPDYREVPLSGEEADADGDGEEEAEEGPAPEAGPGGDDSGAGGGPGMDTEGDPGKGDDDQG